jgi:two-component system phosphate regulon sensor histidine kinase PhoR
MQSRKLIYHIFPPNILVTIGAMLAIIWYGSSTLQQFYMDETRTSLLARAYSIESQVQSYLVKEDVVALSGFLEQIGRKTSARITLISPVGIVISDSLKDPETMDNHQNRPEFLESMERGEGSSTRFSQTLGEKMLYVAIALSEKGEEGKEKIRGVLRVSVSVAKLEKTIAKVKKDMTVAIFVVIFFAALVTIFVSRRISNPLEEMTRGAERFALGKFSPHLIPPDHVATEIATLSHALNSMADQLEDRLSTVLQQRNELQTILDSMLAAVLTVDSHGKLISLNSFASKLLGLESAKSIGKPVEELIRNIDLLKLIERAKKSGEAVDGEIEIDTNGNNSYLLTNCVHLYDEHDESFALLLVLHDVTRIRLLENLHKDFVANVSHELKTPITSIRGYVETILDDNLEDRENAIRFLDIVLKKTNNLNAIIDHLLLLSRIEQQVETETIELHRENVKPVLEEVIYSCAPKAEEKKIVLLLDCPDTLLVKIHAILLEQAVVNLVINAVRYSQEGSEIKISAAKKVEKEQTQIVITVQDSGVGIGKEHLPRLFERFYRSDTARSRKMGGTGLGLAIVKHIAQAHKGDVSVESVVGKGTSVSIILPDWKG